MIIKGGVSLLGSSIYLGQEIDFQKLELFKKFGMEGIFTSAHIPEEDAQSYTDQLKTLGQYANRLNMKLVVDISKASLEHLGLDITNIGRLKNYGIYGLRIDYGFSLPEIKRISDQITVAFNASTIQPQHLKDWEDQGIDLFQVIAWHNYYPRPETGLDFQYFKKVNRAFKEMGLTVIAFMPGEDRLRGPIFNGLPTLEHQRHQDPLLNYLELEMAYVDQVYIGDPGISRESLERINSYVNQEIIILRGDLIYSDLKKKTSRIYHNRPDYAAYVIRAEESRQEGIILSPEKVLARKRGAVTLDNQDYGRYKGELQIVKRDLPGDPRVNVIGQIVEEDLSLLKYIGPSQAFKIDWREVE